MAIQATRAAVTVSWTAGNTDDACTTERGRVVVQPRGGAPGSALGLRGPLNAACPGPRSICPAVASSGATA